MTMAHLYTGQLRLSRMCALRDLAAVTSECPAALRRSAPYKGLPPLAPLRRYLRSPAGMKTQYQLQTVLPFQAERSFYFTEACK